MFVYAAEVAELAADSERLGVHTSFDSVDWPAVRDRIFGRIDPIAEGGLDYRMGLPNVTVYTDTARFTGPRTVTVGDHTITAERVVVAAGARPAIPDVPGLDGCGYHTSDTIMRLDDLPERLVCWAGVTSQPSWARSWAPSARTSRSCCGATPSCAGRTTRSGERFTAAYSRRFDVRFDTGVLSARREGAEVVLEVQDQSGETAELRADELLVATGRIPNGDRLGLDAAGIDTDSAGYVVTDDELRTSVEGVWALGDVTNPIQLKHVANHEARVVRHNLSHPGDPIRVDHRFIPHAVFGYPQVASVGLTERECRHQQIPYRSHVQPFSSAAYGWAMEGHRERSEGDRPHRDRPPARRAHHRPPGVDPDPAANPGHALRPNRRPDGPPPVLHPPGPTRSSRASPPGVVEQAPPGLSVC